MNNLSPHEQPNSHDSQMIERQPGVAETSTASSHRPGPLVPSCTQEERYRKIRELTADDQASVLCQIKSTFRDAAEALKDPSCLDWLQIDHPLTNVTFFQQNPNGSLDAEFHIVKIPRNLTVKRTLTALSSKLRPVPDTFNTTGMIFYPANEDFLEVPLDLPLFRDINCITTHFQKTASYVGSIQDAHAMAIKALKRAKKRPAVIMVNFHWNPIGCCPARNRRPTVSLTAQNLIGLPSDVAKVYHKLMGYRGQGTIWDN